MDKCLECVCKTCARRESDICPDGNPCVCFCANGRTKIKHHCKVHNLLAFSDRKLLGIQLDAFCNRRYDRCEIYRMILQEKYGEDEP